jgi:uncharacterized repeat protein (TIGR01451 family)
MVWIAAAASAATPQYQIFDVGVIQAGDTASQGFGASPGGVAVGRSVRSNASQAFRWTVGGGLVGLPNLAGRNHAVSNDANDSGIVVGTAATTLFGSSRLPVIWNNGVVSQLPLPAGETLGDANGVNASGVAVGSVDGGSLQQAVIYNGANATVITQTTPSGCFFLTAFGINDSGRIVGQGIDPNNAARNVGIVYDMGNPAAFEVGALPGANGALAFAVGNGGHVVGSSMMNQGSGMPFIWSSATGMVAIPLAAGTSQGSARGVNSAGWVVGQDSSAFSIPFLWDGTTTYRLADLLPAGSGWDLATNTSSSALGISDSGVIVGTGVHNGETHAYAMVPVQGTPTPTPTATPAPGPATHFAVAAPGSAVSGTPFNFTVTAQDSANNTATGYTGSVHFTSSDPSAVLPANSTLTNGTGTFQATLNQPGNRTITATDTVNASITGTSNPISIIFGDPTPSPTPSPTPVPPTPTPAPFCVIDTWSATSITAAPTRRFSHSAVWTGSEMIVWGGLVSAGPVFTNTGGRYNPVNDGWTATSTTNAPSARGDHTAVWTGTEMIVWGGTSDSSGGRYNPSTNTWTATSTVNAPGAPNGHTAIWTGSEMIVWGGFSSGGSGGRYNPSTDTWTPTSTVNAPTDRIGHSAIWTGTEMIVWGGNGNLDSGARYNPMTDTWTPTSITNAPPGRSGPHAVWTGSVMIVWGGWRSDVGSVNTGGKYNPSTDSWTPTSMTNAPAARSSHSAVWTGIEMIIWGGAPTSGCLFVDGGRYNPTLDSWTPTQTTDAPQGRVEQTEVWTGRQMIVWGGSYGDVPCPDFSWPSLPNFWNTGGKYCAQAGPTPTPTPPPPTTDYAIAMTDAPDPVQVGQNLTYTITVTNTGPDFGTNVSMIDALPAGVTYVSATSDHGSCTGTSTVTCNLGVFQGNVTILLVVTPTVAGQLSNTANVFYPGDPNPSNNSSTAMTTVIPAAKPTPTPTPSGPTPTPSPSATPTATEGFPPFAEIAVTNADSPDPVSVGQNLTYTITVSNLFGSSEYPPPVVTMIDNLPAGVTFVSVSPSQGSCTGTTTVTCNLGPLTAPNSATVTLVVTPTVAGPLSNTASANSGYFDSNTFNNSAMASTTVLPAGTPTPTPTSTPTQALNLATRMRVQAGDNVGIGGFIITGNSAKTVAIRGIGPSLAAFGLSDFLPDPTLELRNSSGLLLKPNDNWQDDSADAAQLTAHGLALQDPKESGIVATLQPGASYTAILAGKNQTAGVGLVEIYDIDQTADSELANISTRGFVLTGNNVMIGGFILGGSNTTQIVVRGIGPSLAQFGLNPVLADPTLELHDGNGAILISNDNWQDDPTIPALIVALGLAPQDPKESGIVAVLPPGAFTAILAGKNGGTGIGLVEIYNVH